MIPRGRSLSSWALPVALAASLGAVAGPGEPLDRLRAMPPERRQALADDLEEFHRLSGAEQARIRDLDRRIAQAGPEVRERYLDVLRRYNQWLRSLAPDDRARLASTPPDGRMGVVLELLRRRQATPEAELDALLARSSNLHPFSLADQVYWIRALFALPPARRAEVRRAPDAARGVELLESFAAEQGIADDRAAMRERFEGATRPLEGDEPPRVSPANLDRLTAALPGWFLDSLDALPPDAARRRLALLYRLAFPSPAEVPSVRPAAAPGSDGADLPPQPADSSAPARSDTTPF